MQATGPADALADACAGELHPMARKGLELFDAGRYWHAPRQDYA